MRTSGWFAVTLLCTSALACTAQVGSSNDVAELDEPFSSDVATLMDFEFDGETMGPSATNAKGAIRAQLLFTVGAFNARSSVARLDKVQLTNISAVAAGGGLYRIKYHAKLPVAWGSKTNLPTSFALTLPRSMGEAAQIAFTKKYGPACNDGEADSVTTSNYWFHFRPDAPRCAVDAADALRVTAKASVSAGNTVAKYPEYDRVWEDNALNIVAIFSKYEDGATAPTDVGIQTYNSFVAAIRAELAGAKVTPAEAGNTPGPAIPEVTVQLALPGGRSASVTALLVDSPKIMTAAQDARYAELVPWADVVMYNGHAGLGANVRALTKKGTFVPGKYQLFFMDGCDTFAYLDDTLATRRAALNSSDPTGTKYMDIMANAMPAYFVSMPAAAMALTRALLRPEAPLSYTKIFKSVDAAQVVVVTGEEDNTFGAATPALPAQSFGASGAVGYKEVATHDLGTLAAGTYALALAPDWSSRGGDADLRVVVGTDAPLRCTSYKANSNELCTVKLSSARPVKVTVTGDKPNVRSAYVVRGWKRSP